jgi:hypothetical protein
MTTVIRNGPITIAGSREDVLEKSIVRDGDWYCGHDTRYWAGVLIFCLQYSNLRMVSQLTQSQIGLRLQSHIAGCIEQ